MQGFTRDGLLRCLPLEREVVRTMLPFSGGSDIGLNRLVQPVYPQGVLQGRIEAHYLITTRARTPAVPSCHVISWPDLAPLAIGVEDPRAFELLSPHQAQTGKR